MRGDQSRLSGIETPWSVLRKAHDGSDDTVQRAQQALVERYGGAARRYLGAVLRDDESADELFQEFALRLVRGDFCGADPQRGRFRAFVKTALHNLVVDFRRRAARGRRPSLDDSPAADEVAAEVPEDLFVQAWRQELLDRTWKSLYDVEQGGSAPYYSALQALVDEPQLSSAEIAARLATKLGREFTAGNARVVVHRARQMYADQLVAEVADSLETGLREELEQELGELQLLEYCQLALTRRWEELAADTCQPPTSP